MAVLALSRLRAIGIPKLPEVSIGWMLPLVVLFASLLVTPAAVWWKGKMKDQEWRAAIAAQSAEARAILRKGAEDALAVDAEILKALGDTDAKLALAQKRVLEVEGDGSCPRIPARCLGLR